jgi:hypothetical protein
MQGTPISMVLLYSRGPGAPDAGRLERRGQQMPGPYLKSALYIAELRKRFAPDAAVQQAQGFTFRIEMHDARTDVRFDQSEMEDFEVALERFQNTNYSHTLENRIKFRILVAIGQKGLIPEFQISSESSRAPERGRSATR